MKPDDPKLTAYALDELPAGERAELEKKLRTHPEFAAEIEETIEMAQILRRGLRGEPAGMLGADRREAIFVAARGAEPRPVPTRKPENIIELPKWWHRAGPWQAIAACAVFGFGVYAFMFHALKPNPPQSRRLAELIVPVPTDAIASTHLSNGSKLVPPNNDGGLATKTGSTLVNPPKPPLPKPDIISVRPGVNIPTPPMLAEKAQATGNPPETPVEPEGAPKRRGPTVRNQTDPEQADLLAAADIARASQKPGPLNDQGMTEFFRERWREASALREGSSYAQLTELFRPVPGISGQFEMIRFPDLKVDVELVSPEGATIGPGANPAARIKKISNPYLEMK